MIRLLVAFLTVSLFASCAKEVSPYENYLMLEDASNKAFSAEPPKNMEPVLLTWLESAKIADIEADFFDASHAIWLANMRLFAVDVFSDNYSSAEIRFSEAVQSYSKIVNKAVSIEVRKRCLDDWILYEGNQGAPKWLNIVFDRTRESEKLSFLGSQEPGEGQTNNLNIPDSD